MTQYNYIAQLTQHRKKSKISNHSGTFWLIYTLVNMDLIPLLSNHSSEQILYQGLWKPMNMHQMAAFHTQNYQKNLWGRDLSW